MLTAIFGLLFSSCMQLDAALPSSPKERYEALLKEYPGNQKNFINAHSGEGRAAAKAFLAFARDCQEAPEAVESLGWIATHCLFMDEAATAMDDIGQKHATASNLAPIIAQIDLMYGGPFHPAERMLRSILKDSPHPEVRGRATIALAHELIARKENYYRIIHMRNTMVSGKGDGPYHEKPNETAEEVARWTEEATALCEGVLEHFKDLPALFAEAEAISRTIRDIAVGCKAPEIEGHDVASDAFKLSDFRGKVVLLMFSASGCGPCVAMYPSLRSLAGRLKDEPFAMLSVYADPDVTHLKKKIKDGEITWRCWWDGEADGPIGERWNVNFYPTIFVLDANGVIRNRIFAGGEGMESAIDSLVKEAKSQKGLVPN